MKEQLKILYTGPQDSELDEAIMKAITQSDIHATWYAQGYDLLRGVRDICFDLEEK